MAKFLNLSGLQYFWGKIKAQLDTKVTNTTKINGHDLKADITLTAADVKAVDLTAVGAANGVASLDANGLVPSAQLPSYVDDVLEFANREAFPAEGESSKIYVALDTNLTYRWGGTEYVEISSSLALGNTESTAGRGDWTKAAYDHSQVAHAPADAEKNVQADWSVTDTESDAFILNKPVNATELTDGFMSKEDKAKLDKIEAEANKYVLPTAGVTLGGVKTTSEVTDVTTGYTAAPIVDGVVYFKTQIDPEVISNDEIDAIFTEA